MQTMVIPTQTVPLTKTVRVIPAKPEFTSQEKKRSLRVAAYCRVSTKKDEQHMSYEAQRDAYTDKIMKNSEWQFAGIYADKGITGTQATKRPDFMRMINDCKKGKIDLVITKSATRFARNTLDSIENVRLLKNLGIGIIFETQGINTLKMTNELILTMYAGVSQNESENISANVKIGKQWAFKRGSVPISFSSFLGYRKGADGNAEIDPDEAQIIIMIYSEFLSGKSLAEIAAGLTKKGIPTPMGKEKWSSEGVQSILKNEKYMGDVLLQKTYIVDCLTHRSKVNNGELPQYYVENNHPPIIDKGAWNRVQEELARRSGKRKVKEVGTKTEQGKYSGKFALSELLFCGECGTPYRRVTWSKNGKKKVVWRCISRLDYGKKYCKESPTIEESVLQDAILGAIADLVRTSPAALNMLKQHIGIGLSGQEADGDDPYVIQARIGEIENTINELIKREIDSGNHGAHNEQFEKLYAETNMLNNKLAQIRANANHASAGVERAIYTADGGVCKGHEQRRIEGLVLYIRRKRSAD